MNAPNALDRRSLQRKGWLGLAAFAAIPVVGLVLLSASLSLFTVVLLSTVVVGAFAAGFALLSQKLRGGKRAPGLSSDLHRLS